MTARSLVIAAGMAMATMGNPGDGAAEEFLTAPTLVGASLDPVASAPAVATAQQPDVQIHLDKPIDFGGEIAAATSPWYAARLGAESRPAQVDAINLIKRDRKDDEASGPFLAYAGVGLGKIKLSLDLDAGALKLAKERQYKRTQMFLGLGYKVAPRARLALEYRLVTGSDPIFESDTSLAAASSSSKFNNHNILMNFRFRY